MSWKRAFSAAKIVEAEGDAYFEGYFKKSKVEEVTGNKEKVAEIDVDLFLEDDGNNNTAKEKFRPTYTKAVEKEDLERGGFCQPTGLASFIKKYKRKDLSDSSFMATKRNAVESGYVLNLKSTEDNKDNNDNNDSIPIPVPIVESEQRENGMARQICRAWLKNTYLKLGQPCTNQKCERRHIIESKSVGLLYKDYSFKGLTTAQRNSITSQVQSPSASTIEVPIPIK
jgi:hypothetical protein